MSDTSRLKLPFLDAAQAQKHVTVNEALSRIDALTSGRVETLGQTVPPSAPLEGEVHIAGTGSSGAWAGQDGSFAMFMNGGWDFAAPWAGARAWVAADAKEMIFNGTAWVAREAGASSPAGAATHVDVVEIDHVLNAGATSTVVAALSDKSIVLGVTGRVTEAIAGAPSWKLGVAGSDNRYGSGIGTALNSFVHGVSGTPQAYYGDTDLLLTAEGGSFTAGRVTLAIHRFRLTPPAAV